MYLIPTEIRESKISGKGVFTLRKIAKGEIVWRFDPEHDKVLSVDEFNRLDEEAQSELRRVAYLSQTSNKYIYPPEGDPARFTNHSNSNNLSVICDREVSGEPYFIANRDIEIGEELTNNYSEFDDAVKIHKPKWI